MSEDTKVILFLVTFGLLVVGSISWHFARSRAVLEQWAQEEGFEILRRDYRAFFRGPFFWTTSKGQTVYFVTVRDGQGSVRRGWVRCGGWFSGLMTDKAEVRWKD